MAFLKPSELKQQAGEQLSRASWNPRHLILIHTGVIVALNLLVNGLNLYLNSQIGTTGGLGGLGLRSVLQTAQTILSYFSIFFTPFWAAGLLYTCVSIVRGEQVGPRSLLHGFRRFGSLLSYTLWELLIYFFLCMALFYVTMNVYLLTPLAAPFMEQMEGLIQNPQIFLSDGSVNMAMLPVDSLFPTLIPMLILYMVVTIPVVIFISYQFRMGIFLLVEGIYRGAFGAFFVSARLMKGHKWQMLKLDLSFWWYYLLEGLLFIVLYLDMILMALGIPLPFDNVTAFFLTIALHGVLQLGLHWWAKAGVDTTYAAAYESIYREVVPANPDDAAIRQL